MNIIMHYQVSTNNGTRIECDTLAEARRVAASVQSASGDRAIIHKITEDGREVEIS